MYDPTIGRIISEDPIGFAGGDENLFRYVGNSPTNFTDPSGLEMQPLGPANTESGAVDVEEVPPIQGPDQAPRSQRLPWFPGVQSEPRGPLFGPPPVPTPPRGPIRIPPPDINEPRKPSGESSGTPSPLEEIGKEFGEQLRKKLQEKTGGDEKALRDALVGASKSTAERLLKEILKDYLKKHLGKYIKPILKYVKKIDILDIIKIESDDCPSSGDSTESKEKRVVTKWKFRIGVDWDKLGIDVKGLTAAEKKEIERQLRSALNSVLGGKGLDISIDLEIKW